MARRRTQLGPAVDAEIRARTERGETAETIFEAIGRVISAPTIRRRQAELRNGTIRAQGTPSHPRVDVQPPTNASAQTDDTNDIPSEISEATPVEVLKRWLDRVEKGAQDAEAHGNLAALSSLAMRAASLAEAIRRATPLPKADPNDNPDYRALGEQVEKRLFALIDEHLGGRSVASDAHS